MSNSRIRFALKMAGIHFLGSMAVAIIISAFVIWIIYPFPYLYISGGLALLLLVVSVDVVCGPLLTLVLSSPAKHRSEIWRDLGLVVVLQCAALGYGMWTVWEARPLFLVHEVDRFKVITAQNIDSTEINKLPSSLRPTIWSGPLTVSIRDPKNEEERQRVLFESLEGGRDYAERPDFYIGYDSAAALRALGRSIPLQYFLEKKSDQKRAVEKLITEKKADISQWRYIPIVGRNDWVAVVNGQGWIETFLPGDGF
ncbi:pilus assembly protein [Comamonas testosteroni]|uniref:pilus assembly protein n=1 Tax=Comamonas testosteroni TaxID=285 RepID=UPI001E5FE829|nr:pilus assembly protein [Comamonas testosteroni]